MATPTMRRSVTQVGPLQVGICVLVAATALTHLALGAVTTMMVATQPALVASMGGATALSIMAALFYCNFAGYVALVTALYLPALRRFQAITRRALIGYTALTVVAYFALAEGHFDIFGLADKTCEALLIALLVIEGRRAR
jgi:hypothetical protein